MHVVCCMLCVYCLVGLGEVSGFLPFLSVASWLVCYTHVFPCNGPRLPCTLGNAHCKAIQWSFADTGCSGALGYIANVNSSVLCGEDKCCNAFLEQVRKNACYS